MKHGFTSRLESTEKDNNQNTQWSLLANGVQLFFWRTYSEFILGLDEDAGKQFKVPWG